VRKQLETTLDYAIGTSNVEEAQGVLEQRLGVHCDAAHALTDEIVNDLDPQVCGIQWWAPHPDDKRRIFISDYLAQCTTGMCTNLVEAALHLLEAEAAHEAENHRMAHAVSMRRIGPAEYQPQFTLPRHTSTADLVPGKLEDLHTAGFFRAVGSTLDTLAAVVVGVGALKVNIVQVHFRSVVAGLNKQPPPVTPGDLLQGQIRQTINDAVAGAGPVGWLDWAIDYRNMLVHRGRRMHMLNVNIQPAGIFDGQGAPVARVDLIPHLARDPKNSDLQAYFGVSDQPSRLSNLLEEDGLKALRATLEGVTYVFRKTCETLVDVWRARRATPQVLLQPRAQWENLSVQPDQFEGFHPRSVPLKPTQLRTSPQGYRRLEAAAVDSKARVRWKTFTG
jgi:hypothetical protein